MFDYIKHIARWMLSEGVDDVKQNTEVWLSRIF